MHVDISITSLEHVSWASKRAADWLVYYDRIADKDSWGITMGFPSELHFSAFCDIVPYEKRKFVIALFDGLEPYGEFTEDEKRQLMQLFPHTGLGPRYDYVDVNGFDRILGSWRAPHQAAVRDRCLKELKPEALGIDECLDTIPKYSRSANVRIEPHQ